MKHKAIILLLLCIAMTNISPAIAQEDPIIIVPTIPDCDDLDGVQPALLIGGNLTISLGGLELYESYVEQHRDSHLLSLEGEQMFGDEISLQGCFVDELSFILTGTLGRMDIMFVGVAVEPDFSEPTFGGLWYGWTRGYDAQVAPDEKGFFFKFF